MKKSIYNLKIIALLSIILINGSVIFTGYLDRNILDLPNEMLLHIFKRCIKPCVDNFNELEDIIKVKRLLENQIKAICCVCYRFHDLKQAMFIEAKKVKDKKLHILKKRFSNDLSIEYLNSMLVEKLNKSIIIDKDCKQYLKDIVQLIIAGADIECRNSRNGLTALMAAVKNNDQEVAQLLILLGADINAVNMSRLSILILAICHDLNDMVKLLLANRVDIDACYGSSGITPLIYAVLYKKKIDLVKLLVENSAKLDAKTVEDGYTALMLAAKKGRKDIVELLISKNVNLKIKDNLGKTALDLARENNHLAIVKLLTDKIYY